MKMNFRVTIETLGSTGNPVVIEGVREHSEVVEYVEQLKKQYNWNGTGVLHHLNGDITISNMQYFSSNGKIKRLTMQAIRIHPVNHQQNHNIHVSI